jgi:exonuclease I
MGNVKKIIDIDMSEDVQELLRMNPDVRCSDELKDKINKAHDELLMVTKEIGYRPELNRSCILITDVELVTPESIEKWL